MIRADASTATPVPWKNGGGVTRELLRLPAGSGDDWTLRISVADIDADGPFSPFPGITRWFAVLTGAGVRLVFPERVLNVRHGDSPLRFDGADAPGCTLLDGPTRDLKYVEQVRNYFTALHKLGIAVDIVTSTDRGTFIFWNTPAKAEPASTPSR